MPMLGTAEQLKSNENRLAHSLTFMLELEVLFYGSGHIFKTNNITSNNNKTNCINLIYGV